MSSRFWVGLGARVGRVVGTRGWEALGVGVAVAVAGEALTGEAAAEEVGCIGGDNGLTKGIGMAGSGGEISGWVRAGL